MLLDMFPLIMQYTFITGTFYFLERSFFNNYMSFNVTFYYTLLFIFTKICLKYIFDPLIDRLIYHLCTYGLSR